MNIKDKWLVGILIVFTLFNLVITSKRKDPSLTAELFQKYLIDVENKGKKTVVILVSGDVYVDKEPAAFVNAIPIEVAKRELSRAGYSIITLNTPCAIRCLDQYGELALLILSLEAEAVIYKGIHSDFGTDNLSNILNKADIPIYSFGSEVSLDYVLYTGPDNNGLAKAIANSLSKEASQGDRVIYVDTTYKFSSDSFDNGYQRIKLAKLYLDKLGLVEVDTVHTFWNRAKTFEEVTKLLEKEGEVEYIVTPSIETGLGASEAAEKLGYKNVKIIAMDFTEEGVRLLKEEKLYGLVSQGLVDQGLAIATGIIRKDLYLGTKKLFSSDTIITLDNIDQYELTKDNYRW